MWFILTLAIEHFIGNVDGFVEHLAPDKLQVVGLRVFTEVPESPMKRTKNIRLKPAWCLE